jgi:TonB-dependent starch-binding outer membrane protein SusC
MHLLSKLHAMRKYWLLLLLLLTCAAKSWSQTITFSVTGENLEKVFRLIEKQSDYKFIYSSEAMTRARLVTLDVKNESLSSVLNRLFNDQPLSFTTTANKHIVVKMREENKPLAAYHELKGKVINEKGEPISGATVLIRNSTLVTTTDINGEFIFSNARDNVIVVVSSAEMQSVEKIVQPGIDLIIQMKQKLGVLDETIIIGYGKTTRRYSTETVVKVKGEELSRQAISNAVLALSGRVTGLQVIQTSGVPGASVQVRLRGRNSMVNGNDPLYIVDGVPFPSTAMSGVQGQGGGVASSPFDNLDPNNIESIEILKDASATAIYGSRGANGVILITTKKASTGETNVNLQAYYGVGKITHKLQLLNTPQYLAMRREAFSNDGAIPTISNSPDLLLWDTTRYTDWQEQLIGNTMHVTDINASVSGGSGNTQFLFGTGYRNESCVYAGSFYAQKMSGMLNLSHQSSNKKFSLMVSSSFQHNYGELPIDDLTSQIRLSPNAPKIYQPDGKLNWEQSTWTNPYSRIMQVIENRGETWRSGVQLSYKILSGLRVSFSGGFTSLEQQEHFVKPMSSQNPANSPVAEAVFGHKDIHTIILEPQIDYSFSLNNRHRFNLLAGGSLQHNKQTSLYQQGTGYASDELLGSVTAAASVINTGETDIRYRYAAIFTRINYDYAKKYLISLSLRRDGSSRYAPANRFANFGSVGAGWIFTNENLLKNSRILGFGKLRLSAGWTGNDQIGDYKYLDLYRPYTYTYLATSTFIPTQLYNADFGWERVNKLEAGLDLSFFKERLSLTVNYYHNTTTDQLVNYALPSTTGFSGILRNLPATIRNTGLEAEVSGDLISNKKFRWYASFNITFPRNKLVAFEGFESSTYINTYVLGESLFIVKGFQYTGVDPTAGVYTLRDYDNNGTITVASDFKNFVDLAPQCYGGLQQSFYMGRFTLHVFLQYTAQQYGKNYRLLFAKPGTASNQPDYVLDRWQKPGQVSSIQRFSVSAATPAMAYNNAQSSDLMYSNASFIRLKNLQLLYAITNPQSNLQKRLRCDVFIQGQNLFTLTNYQGLDPETGTLLPPVRLITGGMHLNF